MKAVILAADNGLPESSERIPKCLLKIRGSTVLVFLVYLLQKLGVGDITTVMGSEGDCWGDSTRRTIAGISPKTVIATDNLSTRNAHSLFAGIKDIDPNQNLETLIIDGDLVLDEGLLRKVITTRAQNLIVARPALNLSEIVGKLVVSRDYVSKLGKSVSAEDFPWYIYSGLLKIGNEALRALKPHAGENPGEDILNILDLICNEHRFYALLPFQQEMKSSKCVIGGSLAKVTVEKVLKKTADGAGRKKLIDEIKFLKSLPREMQVHFPEIIDSDTSGEQVYFRQVYYELPSVRDLLFRGKIDGDKAADILDRVFNFLFKEVYYKETRATPASYMQDYHFARVWARLPVTEEQAPIFRDIIRANKIVLNGQTYWNVLPMLNHIAANKEIVRQVTPKEISRFTHSDLHLENILVDPDNIDNFILVDPRGYRECDYWYDFGKISHSVNGFYDLLHEDRFSLAGEMKGDAFHVSLAFPESQVKREYLKLRARVNELYSRYSKEDNFWSRVIFNEAMHFSSDMPFHLKHDGIEHRAIAIYVTGARLLNEFVSQFADNFKYGGWVNINTEEEYARAKDWKAPGITH